MLHRSAGRRSGAGPSPFRRRAWLLLGAALAVGCLPDGQSTAPLVPGPPWLAIVTRLDAPAGVSAGERLAFRVRGNIVSGSVFDSTVTARPLDTLIVSVPPAEYAVQLQGGLASGCGVWGGTTQTVNIPEGSNTGVVRYTLICRPALQLRVITEGTNPDDAYVARVRGPGGERLLRLRATDSLFVEGVSSGSYDVEWLDIAPQCALMEPTTPLVTVQVPPGGGARADLLVRCGDPARAPALVAVHPRATGSVLALSLRLADAQRDIARLVWDVTDCRGRSLTSQRPRVRAALRGTRLAQADTSWLMSVSETDSAESTLLRSCVLVRAEDAAGNVSRSSEVPITRSTEGAPVATLFDAAISGERLATLTRFAVSDREGDYLGAVPALRIRDGLVGLADGRPELVLLDQVGLLGTAIPAFDLAALQRVGPADVQAYELWLFDTEGNVRRYTDAMLR
ncbi:MAG: hypothetical protein NW201_05745 [Gemmatimonadales bacterium]|nr:hypothetical protein [Gemmatimonadales bacterium]